MNQITLSFTDKTEMSQLLENLANAQHILANKAEAVGETPEILASIKSISMIRIQVAEQMRGSEMELEKKPRKEQVKFHNEAHRKNYEGIMKLREENRKKPPLDSKTMIEQMRRNSKD